MLTVHDLRKMGYTVKVRHNREYQSIRKMNSTKFSVKPKSGSTEVNIYEDGNLVGNGYSKCCGIDNYNRKLGVKIALGRALKNMGFGIKKNAQINI